MVRFLAAVPAGGLGTSGYLKILQKLPKRLTLVLVQAPPFELWDDVAPSITDKVHHRDRHRIRRETEFRVLLRALDK